MTAALSTAARRQASFRNLELVHHTERIVSPGAIKGIGGIGGTLASNLVGAPLDQFRVLVAQDAGSNVSVASHFTRTLSSPRVAFLGLGARVGSKATATGINLAVPTSVREAHPFSSAFATGFLFAPLLNAPRILQLGKIAGRSYASVAMSTFGSVNGLRQFAANSAVFAPGEGLRMMTCFGMKDWLMPQIGGNVDPREVNILIHSLKMAAIAGPLVAVVETTAALATETITTLHASMCSGGKKVGVGQLGDVLKSTITPKYTSRCFASLLCKNIMSNTPLFWAMFATDFYCEKIKSQTMH
jgi:hypothetical protein